jgi:hypothetical protein
MSKYRNLTLHLGAMDTDVWETTFDEVERVSGTPLPDSARKHRPWWANDGYAQSTAWLGAGWKTAKVDMTNEKVTFVYVGDQPNRQIPQDRDVHKLSIAEAKAGLATSFDVPVDAIEITIRG